jgi:catechol 2,3-dioxygenase-like lactoylglutathione lyase family enzyme
MVLRIRARNSAMLALLRPARDTVLMRVDELSPYYYDPSSTQPDAENAVAAASGETRTLGGNMESVLGIGGLFFRARDPGPLSAWYQNHLGVARAPADYDATPWQQRSGPTVFSPFAFDTAYFGDRKNVWMVNFRVRNLDAMVAQLRAAGIAVEIDLAHYPNGRFARLYDPEGNPIELWQPEGRDAAAANV